MPWVRDVALRRQWPQRLEVTIEEHAPLARWNDAALVNAQGEVFVADYNGELPQFDGPDGSAAEVAARYREWSEALAPLALTLDGVRLSPRGGWRLARERRRRSRSRSSWAARSRPRGSRASSASTDARSSARARRDTRRAGGPALSQRLRGARARIPRTRRQKKATGRMTRAKRMG